jgi:hypothetical protein
MKKNLVSVVIVTKDREKDLLECIDSFLKSDYMPLEIIVIDNASNPSVLAWLPKKYADKIKIVTSDRNLGAAEGRNWGYRESSGKYILFTDDDAMAAKDMVGNLVEVFEKKKKTGIVQPLVYDKQKKNILQGAGHNFDLLTGRIEADGVQERDIGQYDGVRPVPMCGCVWMVKREVFNKIGEYDEDYFIPYEDSDFSIRASRAGYELYCTSEAKTYHQGKKKTFVHPRLEWLGITSAERAYRVARNKMIFMRKHSPFPKNIIFFFLIFPVYLFLHTIIIVSSGRFDVLLKYWVGFLSGLFYIIFYPFMGVRERYRKLDKGAYGFKMWAMAYTEPITLLIDKSAESILDVGCGQGLPMELIKMRMSPKKTVGVDLFEPYIEEARKTKIHDEYVIADVRKLPFKKNSFDVVICLQVLEHQKKKDAIKMLKKMEQIAKKQVIVATPIGEMYHPAVDDNILQMHQSEFTEKDFKKYGYNTLKWGRRSLFGDEGIVHKIENDLLRKAVYFVNLLLTPVYYFSQQFSDYHIYAYKNLEK